MSYVRTEDNIFKHGKFEIDGFGENMKPIKIKVHSIIPESQVIKHADTLEKLCDEFRGVWKNYYKEVGKDAHEEYHYDKEKKVFYDDFEELTPEEALEKFDEFYGAIWTDKGLIYVAKMKGVLPNGEIDWE